MGAALKVTLLVSVLFVMLAVPRDLDAQAGKGGNQPLPNEWGSIYKAQVQNKINQLVIHLSNDWDAADSTAAARRFTPGATLVLGPDRVIHGRDSIQSEFRRSLSRMHGVIFTIDSFDMAGELAFVRGSVTYEWIQPSGEPSAENGVYAMTLRLQRGNVWLITSQTIGGTIRLPPPVSFAGAQKTR